MEPMKENKNAWNILAGKPEEKKPLGRPWRRRDDHIKMDIEEIQKYGVDWIYLAYDGGQVVKYFEHGNEPLRFINLRKFLGYLRNH
jgi:hypothetical protein